MRYVQHQRSQVVMTSWAILALIYAQFPEKPVVDRAARLIMSRQLSDGRWMAEDTEGIFNKNCAINYTGGSVLPMPVDLVQLSSSSSLSGLWEGQTSI